MEIGTLKGGLDAVNAGVEEFESSESPRTDKSHLTIITAWSFSHLTANLEPSVGLNTCFVDWAEGNPAQIQGEHADSTPKRPRPTWDSNLGQVSVVQSQEYVFLVTGN